MTPTVCAPPARAARATAPIIDTRPPPDTSPYPSAARRAPTAAASSRYAGSMVSDDEQ